MASIGFGAAQGLESVLEDLYKRQLEKQRIAEQAREFERLQREDARQEERWQTQTAQANRTFDAGQQQRQADNDYRTSQLLLQQQADEHERRMTEGRQQNIAGMLAMRNAAQDPHDRRALGEQILNMGGRILDDPSPARRQTQVVNDYLVDTQTGEVIKKLPGAASPSAASASGSSNAPSGFRQDAQSAYSIERTNRALATIDQLLGEPDREGKTRPSLISGSSAGPATVLANVPIFGGATDAGTLKAVLNSLRAQISQNELAQMREASRTGGAVGNVSDKDLELLANSLGALDQSLAPEFLRAELAKAKDVLTRWRDGLSASEGAGISLDAARSGMGASAGQGRRVYNPATGRLE